ncbi:hypothetical protein HQ865_02280 [Mucilaginibacter mali]|uniref:CHRD domain-containing protein n=1 Tax=Mucilaginibacter mali TaxID=2740462 RepID=A0A7D4Q5K8_9SPHI|nr:hypothetical protein [Mucilaginibacter mali]QKJ28631.1 hypothetical protein HQ865_02280 [Mucilaginibacter mali]
MKAFLTIILLSTIAKATFAQSDTGYLLKAVKGPIIYRATNKAVTDTNKGKRLIICGPSRGRLMSAVTVIFVRNKLIYKSDTGRNNGGVLGGLNPQLIAKVNVLNGMQAASRYGDIARYGTIEISIDPMKNRPAYRELKKQIEEAIANK